MKLVRQHSDRGERWRHENGGAAGADWVGFGEAFPLRGASPP